MNFKILLSSPLKKHNLAFGIKGTKNNLAASLKVLKESMQTLSSCLIIPVTI